MNVTSIVRAFAVGALLASGTLTAGPFDPDCTAEKAAKSAAMKATVGVGGRCTAKEAATDTVKRETDIDPDRRDKGDKGLLGRDKDKD